MRRLGGSHAPCVRRRPPPPPRVSADVSVHEGAGHSCRLLSPSPSTELRIALPGPGGALGTICPQSRSRLRQALPVLALNVGRGVEGVGGPFPRDSVGNLLL